jgi:hypothetical protein
VKVAILINIKENRKLQLEPVQPFKNDVWAVYQNLEK